MLKELHIVKYNECPMERILFAQVTPKSCGNNIDLSTNIEFGIQKPFDDRIDYCVTWDNTDGLPKAYNRILNEYADKYDTICFCHDDITLNDCLVYDKLKDARKRGMDVIGVAGGKGYVPPKDPNIHIGWNTASRDAGLAGFIVHRDGDTTFATTYGPTPSPTLTVDGCFFALMNRGLELRFDEQYGFHFYDMDICLEAYKKGMKVGVEPIVVTHGSIGRGLRTPEFLVEQKKFLKKWFSHLYKNGELG